jgi:glycosyltransferase involved in cell wall biosynthesis
MVDGGRRRTLELLVALGRRVEVEVCAVEEPAGGGPLPVDADAFRALRLFPRSPLPPGVAPLAARPERWFHSRALARWLAQEDLSRFDALFLDEPWLLRAVPRGAPPVVAHHHKLEVELARELGHPWHERLRVARLERMLALRAALHVFAGEEDRVRFLGRHPAAATAVLPAGIDPARFVPPTAARARDRLLFFGSLGYEPNRRALRWIQESLWPALSRTDPALRLRIVGAGELPASWGPLPAGMERVGYVADPLPELQAATALLAPMDIAGGARQKLVEALATGCPVVATPTAVEGLPSAEELVELAEPGAGFLAATRRLLSDPEPALERASRSARVVREAWSWRTLADQLANRMGELV